MPIDQERINRARPEFESFVKRPFPELPQGAEFSDLVTELLILDPRVGALATAAVNRRIEVADLRKLDETIDRLAQIKAELVRTPARASEDVPAVAGLVDYIDGLLEVGRLLGRAIVP
ncbi:hypothetical protein AB0K18_48155 [Nonomuraea sp. NPDC049421]|uniref:hypothetical protein n=1 Tax=Nonomuraea sp. NPDC049421 TaxID=3155275 RepID=UPI003448A5F0